MTRLVWPAAVPAVLGALLLLAGAPRAGTESKAISDEQFVQMASAADLAEINLGELATRRAA